MHTLLMFHQVSQSRKVPAAIKLAFILSLVHREMLPAYMLLQAQRDGACVRTFWFITFQNRSLMMHSEHVLVEILHVEQSFAIAKVKGADKLVQLEVLEILVTFVIHRSLNILPHRKQAHFDGWPCDRGILALGGYPAHSHSQWYFGAAWMILCCVRSPNSVKVFQHTH